MKRVCVYWVVTVNTGVMLGRKIEMAKLIPFGRHLVMILQLLICNIIIFFDRLTSSTVYYELTKYF